MFDQKEKLSMTNESTTHLMRRSRKDRILFGVCGGLAEFTGINVFWFRLFFLIAALPGGIPAWPYLVLAVVMPSE
jgi:phage shock protein C